jgi:hypothetical protein
VKTFWVDTKITGQEYENNLQIGTFEGLFGDSRFKPTVATSDNAHVAKMCEDAIRALVLKKGVQPAAISKNAWTNQAGLSVSVASTAVRGQRLCVTVSTASCFPASIHAATEALGTTCTPNLA